LDEYATSVNITHHEKMKMPLSEHAGACNFSFFARALTYFSLFLAHM
jgi:hypothetical protein